MKIISIALLSAMAFLQVPQSGGSIRGVVMRAGTTSPIAGARVVLRTAPTTPNFQAAITDNDGKFVFSGVEPGDYTLQFAAAGYLTVQQQRSARMWGPSMASSPTTRSSRAPAFWPCLCRTAASPNDIGRP
jgi:hypothetical protein